MVISSIDLLDGKAVQLEQGKEKILEESNVLALAKKFNFFGEIAVIDLNAAFGNGNNFDLIRQILKIADCRVGGGIRDIETAKKYLALGAKKIIIGSKAFENDKINFDFLAELRDSIGIDKIIIAIDSKDGKIVTSGWKHDTGINTFEAIEQLEDFATEFLFTNVIKEGMLKGADIDTAKSIRKITKRKVVYAGGVTTIDEIREFAKLNIDVQLGMALYKGLITLEDAFINSLQFKNGLIPTITQDESGRVLTLAYSSRESIRKMFETKKTWFYSRSRQKLWMKGEESGNIQDVLTLRADCDYDALLVKVKPHGPACHTGNYSCFGYKDFSLLDLYEIIEDRFRNPVPGSYTASLDDRKVRKKLMEEAYEVVEAQNYEEKVWEVADLIYFTTVLMVKERISFDDVLKELYRRRFK